MAMKTCYTVINGQVVSEDRNGVARDYLTDGLGNTLALLDNTQTKTDTFDYFPSGAVAARTGTTQTPFQWVGGQGYYKDSGTRTHVRARNFHNNLGRWGSQDPIGFDAGDFNLYRYVGNRFVAMTDPSGLVRLEIYKPKEWVAGHTPVDGLHAPKGFGEHRPCCCGAFKGMWEFKLSKPVKCKDRSGAFVQYIHFNHDAYYCPKLGEKKGIKIEPMCKGYLEMLPVQLDENGNLSFPGEKHVDGFVNHKNLGLREPTEGSFRQIGEAKFFCSENMDENVFGNDRNEDTCKKWSGGWKFRPVDSPGQLPRWWRQRGDDGDTAYHQGSATWDCCNSPNTSDTFFDPSPAETSSGQCV